MIWKALDALDNFAVCTFLVGLLVVKIQVFKTMGAKLACCQVTKFQMDSSQSIFGVRRRPKEPVVALEVLYRSLVSDLGQIGFLKVASSLKIGGKMMQNSCSCISLVPINYNRAIKPETVRLLIYQQEQ